MAEQDLVTAILGQLVSSIGRVDEKLDDQSVRIDKLIETTNHRLDDFRGDMYAHRQQVELSNAAYRQQVSEALTAKADRTDLITSIGFRLGNNKIIRWAIGVGFAAILGTATWNHWWAALLKAIS